MVMNIRKNALVVGAVITLVTWFLMAAGAFRIPDGLVYSLLVRLTPPSAASSNVLVVKAGFERMGDGDDVWLALLRELRRLGARQVVFTIFPPHAGRRFYEEAAASSIVIFGREFREYASTPEARSMEQLPSVAADLKLPFGILVDPPDEFGTHRYQHTTVEVNGSNYPTLEAAAAGRFTGTPIGTKSPVLINFLGREGGIPHVSLDRALGGGLIPELVKGKSVIIGFSNPAHEPGLRTPLAGAGDMALLDYRAHALDTLIAKNGIAEVPFIVQCLFVALIVFAGLVFQTFFEMRFLTWLTLAAVAAFLGASWMLLLFGHIWVPVTELFVAFSLTFLLIFRQRVLLAEQAVNTMLLNLSAKLKQRVMPESFYTSQEYWSQVITMVNQTLNLTRAIFLEKVPGDHRVREVKALHCSITDISEQRRDYERTPYSTAIAGGGPLRLDRANYLTGSGTEEDQYLVPLIFGGQPLGFWAFGIAPETAEQIPYFEGTIRDFGNQISELLYRRQEWQAQQRKQNSFTVSYLDLSRDVPHEELKKSIDLFERRVNTLETVFAELGTATILYDLFGRVLLVNRRMVETLKGAGLAPFELTALDLAVALSGLKTEEVRHKLHKVLLEHGQVSLAASLIQAHGREYVLRIRPLLESGQKPLAAEARPFSVYGILFELVDLSEISLRERDKDRFVAQIPARLTKLLEPVAAAATRLDDETLAPEVRQTLVDDLRCKASETLAFVADMERCLEEESPAYGQEGYPVDGLSLLREAAVRAERELVQRRITTTIFASGTVPFVRVAPKILREAFHAFIIMLGNDSRENSAIRMEVGEDGNFVAYRFVGAGFGMPDDVLQRVLFSDEPTDSVENRRSRAAVHQVWQWQGTVVASSQVGSGISIEVRLRKFT